MKWILVLVLGFSIGASQPADRNYLLGKFNPATDSRFSLLMKEHTAGSARGGFLRREAYDAFVKMAGAAGQDGIKLVIISATRNFESQKKIWENKWNGKVLVEGKNLTTVKDPEERARIILRYSSMPGTSRHHWGTDMDLNSLENSYFESAAGLRIYQWLTTHAADYGFCQPYTSKANGRTGYEEEKWHWSYLPLARQFLDDYQKRIQYPDLTGFDGSEISVSMKIKEDYVQGVSCR
jgi:hypothetical protein